MIIVNLYNIKWKKKISRKDLAEALNMSPSTITKLTNDKHVDLKLSTIERICKFFNCSVHDILVEVDDETLDI